MSDSFEFTSHSPLTKEDWNKISDAEFENTTSVTFQTPQGRQVRYIKCEVLDKIRAEIEALPKTYPFVNHIDTYVKEDDVKKIIDKYKAESEE
jgi:hypothetical protein